MSNLTKKELLDAIPHPGGELSSLIELACQHTTDDQITQSIKRIEAAQSCAKPSRIACAAILFAAIAGTVSLLLMGLAGFSILFLVAVGVGCCIMAIFYTVFQNEFLHQLDGLAPISGTPAYLRAHAIIKQSGSPYAARWQEIVQMEGREMRAFDLPIIEALTRIDPALPEAQRRSASQDNLHLRLAGVGAPDSTP